MKEFVCTDSVVPLRTGPSHRAENGSQILLGERYIITDRAGKWSKIEMVFDNYSGWVDNDHFIHCENSSAEIPQTLTRGIKAYGEDGTATEIYCGSEIYELSADRKNFRVGNDLYRVEKAVEASPPENNIVSTAGLFINAPYLWGGRIRHGIDCSGLTQLVHKMHGKALPRNSYDQATVGDTVNLLTDAIAGDLLFFDNDDGNITHVGMLYDPLHIIHASGKVRIDPVDHQGIYRSDLKRYSHKLRIIKRIK